MARGQAWSRAGMIRPSGGRRQTLVPDEAGWLAEGMSNHQPHDDNLPSDSHLQEDISLPSDDGQQEAKDHFAPGQTNAGQQVSGLASATDYGADQEPPGETGNNPI